MTGMTGNPGTNRPWHVDAELAGAYAAGRTDPVLTASLEQHVLGCAACRALVGDLASPASLDTTWLEVLERVERPQPRPLERLLLRTGVDPSTARLIALTPSLRGAWLAGVVVVLTLALALAYGEPDGVAMFLAIAPVLPAVGVAFAFGPAADPAHELASAAPYSSLRLLAVRTALVVGSTLGPAAIAGVLLPGRDLLAVAWLMPAFALAAGTLALATRVSPLTAVIGLAGTWLVVATTGLHPRGNPELVAEPGVQLLCLALLLLAAGALVRQRGNLAELIRRIG